MIVVSNTSPLIYLSKIKKISLLKKLFGEIIIPKQVYDEVIVKSDIYLDVNHIKQAVKENWIKIKEIGLTIQEKNSFGEIDLGEIAVIKLAQKQKARLVLNDDASARIVVESLGIKVKGTLYVLIEAYSRKLISKTKIKGLVKTLISEGFRISSEVYARFLEELESS